MKFIIKSPSKAFISDFTKEEYDSLVDSLTYTNETIKHQLKRVYDNHWFRSKNPEGWQSQVDTLKKQVKQTVIYDSDDGEYIRPGSLPYLSLATPDNVINLIKYPTAKKVPWNKPLPFELHRYQELSWTLLLQEKHGNVELCTAAGKTAILKKLCRETGFKTAIVAPSRSIFLELVKSFEHHFGKAKVGTFGDGKKKIGKQFTICIGDSLANVKPDTEEWEFFSNLDMFCADESHTWGAESLDEICHGILADIPYRFFFSGTQTRGDGTEVKLQSIIGKTVYTLPTWEAVEKGYIADHEFRIIGLESSNPNFNTKDALEMKREHFLNNKNIAQFAAKLANSSANMTGKQTLILVEELNQIKMIKDLITVPFAYAHSEKNAKRLLELGLDKVDTDESVEKFNRNEVKVLIGTSCIATGTNIYPTHQTCNWVGGASEIKTKQGAVGRSVRLHKSNPYKDNCVEKDKAVIFDFDVRDIFVMERHLESRLEYYKDSRRPIKYIGLK